MSEGLAGFATTSTTYDELLAGEPISVSGVVATGQGILIRGTILGKNGTTGKWARAETPPSGILAHTVDTTAGDVTDVIHIQGKFKDNVVVLPAGKTMAETKAALWDFGVYLLDVQE